MSQFSDWFNIEYKHWCQSQPGEEDFLGFCDLLGYPPAIVVNWLQGDSIPQGAELLSVASLFGTKVYVLLEQPEPDTELLKIYDSFNHISGESRSRLAHALWEAQAEMIQKGVLTNSEEAKTIFRKSFTKWGFETPNKK
jgi:hypothetical protein